jgi:hypothetical protein
VQFCQRPARLTLLVFLQLLRVVDQFLHQRGKFLPPFLGQRQEFVGDTPSLLNLI